MVSEGTAMSYESRRIFVSFFAALVLMTLATGLAAVAGETKLAVCPVSLSNPDGQELEIERYDLRAAVHGPLALVEMEMVFRNPLDRQMEGRFLYLLPPNATVSRFAKEVEGTLMEGEVVETQRARAIYREILHSMRDPALLEQDQGNRFSAKVFPIPAKGTARLVLSYTQLLPLVNGERTMTVPLAGMQKIGAFKFTGFVQYFSGESLGEEVNQLVAEKQEGGMMLKLAKNAQDWTPDQDLVLTFKPALAAPRQHILRAGNYQMVCYRPELPPAPAAEVRDWVFYFDTSASGADVEQRKLKTVQKLLDGIRHELAKFRSFSFDLEVSPLFDMGEYRMGNISDGFHVDNVALKLRKLHALGATDLGKALKHIGETARATEKPARFVLVSDGIATWGKREVAELLAELGDWPAKHVLHALVIGSKQDEKVLSALTAKANGRVVLLPLTDKWAEHAQHALSELTAPAGYSFQFYDEGANWIYPQDFRDVRPGGELIVFSEIKENQKPKPGVVYPKGLGKVDVALDAIPGQAPQFAALLQREAAAAQLKALEAREREEKDAAKVAESRKQRLALSVKHRVLCPPLTSLLVLETERDYERFQIDRNSLSDIMAVTANGIELKQRKAEDLALRPVPVATRKTGEKGKSRQEDAKKITEAKAESAKQAQSLTGKEDDFEGKDLEMAVDKLAAFKDEANTDMNVEGESLESALGNGRRLIMMQHGGSRAVQDGQAGGTGGGGGNPFAGTPAEAPAPTGQPAAAAPEDRTREAERRQQNLASAGSARDVAARADAPNELARMDGGPSRLPLPAWTKHAGHKPAEDEFAVLRAKVDAQPKDRSLRNAYAFALAQAENWDALQAQCFDWLPFDPENPQIFEYLGKSAAGLEDAKTALRALSSLAEVAPNDAALLGRAGWVLLSVKQYEMAAALFHQALKQRQDDPNLYRGLALTVWQAGKLDDAIKVYEDALKIDFNSRYGDVKRVLKEELFYVNLAMKPGRAEIPDALRITLAWETDANDVDLHVVDPNGEECFYSHPRNASGLELYSDQTQGLGPEVIRCQKALKGTYHIGVKYFSAGPMGVSRGVVVIFQPKHGVDLQPTIVPFCLIPDADRGQDMRHLAVSTFSE